MTYIPHTEEDIKQMLQVVGVKSVSELFADIPEKLKNTASFELEKLSDPELMASVKNDLRHNQQFSVSFLGAGSYQHFIPSVVKHLAGRSEFYTAYTPYQPEISQGTLRAIYEYQSMICQLTGLDVSNASMYDGASALAEAVILAYSFTGKKEICLANPLNPNYRKVLQTYSSGRELKFTDKLSDQTAAVVFSLPDFEGNISDYRKLLAEAKLKNALFIVLAHPHLLAALDSPGSFGVDIVVGEGQPLGIAQSFGGPGLGFFAAKNTYLRNMPGRIVGRTSDIDGKESYVLTMQTREQHIRREKATSNICSNEALCALMATIYISYMGSQGLQKVAQLAKKRADEAKQKLSKLEGFKVLNQGDTFLEFVLQCPKPVLQINAELAKDGICGGFELSKDKMLVACTELTTSAQIDLLVQKLRQFTKVLA